MERRRTGRPPATASPFPIKRGPVPARPLEIPGCRRSVLGGTGTLTVLDGTRPTQISRDAAKYRRWFASDREPRRHCPAIQCLVRSLLCGWLSPRLDITYSNGAGIHQRVPPGLEGLSRRPEESFRSTHEQRNRCPGSDAPCVATFRIRQPPLISLGSFHCLGAASCPAVHRVLVGLAPMIRGITCEV